MFIGYCFRLLSSTARLLFQFDTAKLVNIFHSTKYFDKKIQNIFNYFFSLPREKVFPAQRAIFSTFLMILPWRGKRGISKKWNRSVVMQMLKYNIIYFIYIIIYIKLTNTIKAYCHSYQKSQMPRLPRHAI